MSTNTNKSVLEQMAEALDLSLLDLVQKGYKEGVQPDGSVIRKPLSAADLEVIRKRLHMARVGVSDEAKSMMEQLRVNVEAAGLGARYADGFDDEDVDT